MDHARGAPTADESAHAAARLLGIFSQVADGIENGGAETAITILAGALLTVNDVAAAGSLLRSHPLHSILLDDPYTARAFHKPRGYAGDALVMDMIYDRVPPLGTSPRGLDLFAITTGFPVAHAVRARRDLAARLLEEASARGHRVCSLACGHMRELDLVSEQAQANLTAVDQDGLSVEYVRRRYSPGLDVQEMNVFAFLRRAIARGEKYDLIYTLGFTDYCDARAMSFLLRLMAGCLSDGGSLLVANFAPGHLAQGWLDVCLDWRLAYRDEWEMQRHAQDNYLASELWRDATRSIVYSRMTRV